MPYAHISHAPNSTLDDYRAVNDDIDGPSPDGLLLTIVGADTAGLYVIDLWQSKDHADRFAAELLLPAFTRTGKGPDATATYAAFDTDEITIADGFHVGGNTTPRS
jgi:hypothetical protein